MMKKPDDRWWYRAEEYVIDGAHVRPRTGSTLRAVNPLSAGRPSRYHPSASARLFDCFETAGRGLGKPRLPQLLQWFADFGALGLFPATVLTIETTESQGEEENSGGWWGHQQVFISANGVWEEVFQDARGPLVERVLVQNLSTRDLSWLPGDDVRRQFFPNRPLTAPFPRPFSQDFWRAYAEPLEGILTAARALFDAQRAAARNTLPLSVLASTTRAVLRDGHLVELPSSMIGALAREVLQALTTAHVEMCARKACKRPFLANAYGQHYCSLRCRAASQKAVQRARKRADQSPGPMA